MKIRNLSYTDSKYSGNEHSTDWIAKPYSIVFTTVIFFILIFGIAIFLGWRQFNDTRSNFLTADKTTANILADLILQHNRATIGILQSYAHRPQFVDAARKKDVAGIDKQLSDLKKNAEIDLTFVTDNYGILWANFPVFPEAIGKDLSQRDWYKGISTHWKPYISTVFKLIVGDKPLAVAVCVPIFDEKERVIGILASSQRLGYLVDTIEGVPFSPYTTVNVIDRAGQILYSNKVSYQENITDYRFFPITEQALKEKKQQIEMNDQHKGHDKRCLSVVPLGEIGWTVIIERAHRDILRSEFRRFIEIGAVSFLLFLLITFFLVYLRKAALFRKTEELLQAETKLRQSEQTLCRLSSRQEAILAAVPAIIMEVDNNKIYTWANSAGIEFFGEDVIGKEAAFYFEGEQDTYDKVRPLFNSAEDIVYVESWQRRRDGEKKLLAWWCRVLRNEKGNVEGALSSAYDITERKRIGEALQASENRYRELSIVDDLTQLYNSRHFYFQLKIELDRSNRYELPLTLLLLDLDNFKTFNDTYGHIEGDQVLMRLGQVVKRCLRQTDSAYRYGGEEFTILLPMTTSVKGAITAERVWTEFKKETFSPAQGQDVHVTVSIGLGQYKPQEDMKAFVHRVDQLMYQAKKNGKNRVCSES